MWNDPFFGSLPLVISLYFVGEDPVELSYDFRYGKVKFRCPSWTSAPGSTPQAIQPSHNGIFYTYGLLTYRVSHVCETEWQDGVDGVRSLPKDVPNYLSTRLDDRRSAPAGNAPSRDFRVGCNACKYIQI